MTLFTAITLGTITTISALREINKKEEAAGYGIAWHLCRDIGDVVVDYSKPCHHVRVERVNILEVLA